MGIQPGSEKSSLRVQQPVVAKSAPSAGLQKLTKEAQKLPGQVKAMSAAIKGPAAGPSKAAAPGKTPKK